MGNAVSIAKHPYEEIELGDKSLPQFDKASGTRTACIIGLVFSACVGIACIVVGAVVAKGSDRLIHITPVAHVLIPFLINFGFVLPVTESLSYVHMVCLRWNLLHESRLEFNANLRLLTFSKTNPANGLLANILFSLAIAFCYAASSMIFVQNTYEFHKTAGSTKFYEASSVTSFTKVPPIALGVAILVLCVLSTWSLLTSKILTWSSNPLNTLAAAISKGAIIHRDGRAMMSVHHRKQTSAPVRPSPLQRPPIAANSMVPKILFGTIGVLFALIAWMGIMIGVGYHNKNGMSWNIIPTATINGANSLDNLANQTMTVYLQWFTTENPGIGPNIIHEPMMAGVLVFTVAIQSILTIGLHTAELQITLLRDEDVWREMTSKGGSVRLDKYNSYFQPLLSWQNVVLLIFKPAIHWMFGSAMGVDYAAGILMRVPHVTYLAILWVLFLLFMLQVSYTKPKGPLPASYGHLQTMANIIDEWAPRMYWGDKGELPESGELRHAGTKNTPLPMVERDSLYQ
ncbi:hypothetical protein NA57DRAFT_78346 [Rhizodiscina lignyota]|uniref:Uncharacterized protein n=1 Tax=Rhizodiscina lignyota TaxID=1504668 RepID=A0A9P4IEI3_9PEZI|nr:hypothetical protein NA57DRAFT_78346 [Rhizodiscina lignyota]